MLLLDQDRARWDRLLIRARAGGAGARASRSAAVGPYALQAAIAACHARARAAEDTDWARIARALRRARAGRAVAGRRAQPRGRGLDGRSARRPAWRCSTRSPTSRALRGYHLLPAVRGDLLERLGRAAEARAEFARAAALTRNERERDAAARADTRRRLAAIIALMASGISNARAAAVIALAAVLGIAVAALQLASDHRGRRSRLGVFAPGRGLELRRHRALRVAPPAARAGSAR